MTTDAFPDRKYDGQIAEISPEADRQKATVQVKVQILNPDSYLRPDMNATVKFLANENKSTESRPDGGVRSHHRCARSRWQENTCSSHSTARPWRAKCKSSRSEAVACWFPV